MILLSYRLDTLSRPSHTPNLNFVGLRGEAANKTIDHPQLSGRC